jgi:hypothetical protein
MLKKDLRENWERYLEQWKASGLTGSEWCRENNLTYCVFLYWKKKLNSSHPFVELKDSSTVSEIEVEFQGFLIRLSKNFDEQTFQKCVQTLKRTSCLQ